MDDVECKEKSLSSNIAALPATFRAQIRRLMVAPNPLEKTDIEDAIHRMGQAYWTAQSSAYRHYVREGSVMPGDTTALKRKVNKGVADVIKEISSDKVLASIEVYAIVKILTNMKTKGQGMGIKRESRLPLRLVADPSRRKIRPVLLSRLGVSVLPGKVDVAEPSKFADMGSTLRNI